MSMMKQLMVLLIASSLAIPAAAQRRGSPNARNKARGRGNRPPIINSFTSSHGTVVMLCPGWLPNAIACSPDGHMVTLTTNASDPDGDELRYEYSGEVGEITSADSNASWDFWGAPPGSYVIKVVVTDRRGGVATESFTVKVEECSACDPPCTTLTLSCSSDVEEGAPVICTANVSGGEMNLVLTYGWTVSSGRITKGQGTPTIEIDTTGLAGQQLSATVDVGGVAPECASRDSFTTQIRKR